MREMIDKGKRGRWERGMDLNTSKQVNLRIILSKYVRDWEEDNIQGEFEDIINDGLKSLQKAEWELNSFVTLVQSF